MFSMSYYFFQRVATSISNIYLRRYVVQYNASGSTPRLQYTSQYYYYSTPSQNTITINGLLRDRNYSISVRHQLTIQTCNYYSYVSGPYSEPITVSTNNTGRMVPVTIINITLIMNEYTCMPFC